MKITRIGNDREAKKDVAVIDIRHDDIEIRITPTIDGFHIHMLEGYMDISPCCANEIKIKGRD